MREQEIIHTESLTPFRRVLSASTLTKDSVRNRTNEDVGSLKEIMIDVPSGRVAYAVLAVGGFLGIGERLFAIPWGALALDQDRKCFILDVDKQRLQNAPGFDKDNWPDMADPSWAAASVRIGAPPAPLRLYQGPARKEMMPKSTLSCATIRIRRVCPIARLMKRHAKRGRR